MTCPRCGFALITFLGHDTCSMGCGFDGPTREPTPLEAGQRRSRAAQLRGNPGPRRKVA